MYSYYQYEREGDFISENSGASKNVEIELSDEEDRNCTSPQFERALFDARMSRRTRIAGEVKRKES